MSFNQLMHPRNIYRVKPDYLQLGEKYPSFKEFLTFYKNGKPKLNFDDPQALRFLTITLLDNDFNLQIDLPIDRMIPAVPQRLNYVLWVEDLLTLLDLNPSESINGLDIGTGACCIFPLLGCKTNKSWTFIATEADDISYQFALNNVQTNLLNHRIKVIKVTSDVFLLNLPGVNELEAHFLMCNPPFFNDRSFDDHSIDSESGCEEMSSDEPPAKKFIKKPSLANLSTILESVTPGGEVDFVKKIIDESLILKESIKIYTVMLGHKKSSIILSQHLKNISDVKDTVVNQFFQGRTMRWGLAWTFLGNLKLSESIKITDTKRKNKKNIPLKYIIPKNLTAIHYSLQSIYRFIRHLLRDELGITTVDITRESNHSIEMIIRSQSNTWSHQRRRKRTLARASKGIENEKVSEPIGEEMDLDSCTLDTCTMNALESPAETVSSKSDESLNDSSEASGIRDIMLGKRKADDSMKEKCNHEEYKKSRDQGQVKTIVKDEELYLLHCSLVIRRTEDNFIVLEMKTKDNAKSKDATNQLLQFFKNSINNSD